MPHHALYPKNILQSQSNHNRKVPYPGIIGKKPDLNSYKKIRLASICLLYFRCVWRINILTARQACLSKGPTGGSSTIVTLQRSYWQCQPAVHVTYSQPIVQGQRKQPLTRFERAERSVPAVFSA